MSARLREGLADLGRDVALVRLAPPERVRARGEARRRRVAAGVVTGAVGITATVALAVAVPVARGAADGRRDPQARPSLAATATGTCSPSPLSSVVKGSPPPDFSTSRRAAVFLRTDAAAADRNAVDQYLRTHPAVASYSFEDRAAAWQRFAEIYCDQPDLVAATNPESLPESFQVQLDRAGDFDGWAALVKDLPGVDTVIRVPE